MMIGRKTLEINSDQPVVIREMQNKLTGVKTLKILRTSANHEIEDELMDVTTTGIAGELMIHSMQSEVVDENPVESSQGDEDGWVEVKSKRETFQGRGGGR